MGLSRAMQSVVVLLMFLLFGINTEAISSHPNVFNVMRYGARADGKTDNTRAFLKAWNEACQWKGMSKVLVPTGTFKLGSAIFTGPCKSPITIQIQGLLKASTDQGSSLTDHWIIFRYVDGLTVTGNGSLDGQGATAWPLNDCHKNNGCKRLSATMRFDYVTNSNINHITSINSKGSHFNIYGGKNMNFSDITISAPVNSPNTDGIHMGDSTEIRISRSRITTGDDCISLSPGSRDVTVLEVHCGAGHGISIGSLGRGEKGETVKGLTVKNCTFTGTTNGVRIKTWGSSPGVVSDVRFEDIVMNDVYNPIIIDQQYCPYPPCRQQAPSQVQISNVTFRNIHGTSRSLAAVNLKCSPSKPCKYIKLEDINLVYRGTGRGPATSSCSYVNGGSYGYQNPRSCI